MTGYFCVSFQVLEDSWQIMENGFLKANMKQGISFNDFSTPIDLIGAIVKLLEPTSDEKIYDGACGYLGFLLEAKNYIEKNESTDVKTTNLSGREINKEIFDQALNLASKNGLKESHFNFENSLNNDGKDTSKFDIVMSNPPFGLKSQNSEGELGFKTSNGTNKFLQHYINSLKMGGRAAVIITNSFFFEASKAGVGLRKYLIENCNLHTVLGLPQNTFSYTAINSSVLFFSKIGICFLSMKIHKCS